MWILIVLTTININMGGATMNGEGYGESIAFQEFASLKSCQHASLEIAKIARTNKAVCVPKG